MRSRNRQSGRTREPDDHVGPALMASVGRGVLAGVLAGAAGATALNAVTYLDQAIRARPAGDTSGQTVVALADAAGVEVPGDPEQRQNRLEGLGPLSGLSVGLGVGAVAGALQTVSDVPFVVAAAATGLGAMTVSDTTMAALKISDPRSWTPMSVVGDAIPHLVYGVVTTLAIRLMLPRRPGRR